MVSLIVIKADAAGIQFILTFDQTNTEELVRMFAALFHGNIVARELASPALSSLIDCPLDLSRIYRWSI